MSERHQNRVGQRRSQLLTLLQPQLLAGERVELLSFAMVGNTPVKKERRGVGMGRRPRCTSAMRPPGRRRKQRAVR